MTWFNDGDGWRDESTEGPYDTLKTLFKDPDYQIFRSYTAEKYDVQYRHEIISQQDSVALAKAFAEQHYRENKK